MTVPADDPAGTRIQIAAEVLEVHKSSYGKGADRVTAHLLDDLVVVWLDQIELTMAEQALIDGGHSDTVLETRAAFQQAIEPTFSAIVERATGRQVASFLSTTSLAAMCSVELFRLHPVAA